MENVDTVIAGIVVTVLGGILLWLFIYLLKIVIALNKAYGTLIEQQNQYVTIARFNILSGEFQNLSNMMHSGDAVQNERLRILDEGAAQSVNDRIKLHQIFEEKLVSFHNQMDIKVENLTEKINDLTNIVVRLDEKIKK